MELNQPNDYDMRKIGVRLKSGLVDADVTIDDLAKCIGVSRFAVQDWILGRSRPKLTDAARICDALGKPLDWLARRDDLAAIKA